MFFLVYLVGTVVLFYVGPWRYPVHEHAKLLTFLLATHAALALGYLRGMRAAPRASRWAVSARVLALGAIGLDLALLLPTCRYYTGDWLPAVWHALADPGGVYAEAQRRQYEAVPYVNYVRILLAPALASSMPLGIFYWQRLGIWGRGALVALAAGTLALFVAMGTNKGLGEWAMIYPWFVLAGLAAGELRLSRRAKLSALGLGIVSVALFLAFFGVTMLRRPGSPATTGRMAPAGAVLATPPVARTSAPATTMAGLTSYLTQGYYAVYLCLEEPFVPMWGVGHSLFLQRQAARLTANAEIVERSYPERIEAKGWNATRSWATIYPWIASDVGFAGAVVVVFLIGRLLASLWIDALGGENPFAVAALGPVLVMLYYFPAHNRCLQTGEGVISFWGLLLVWWLSRRSSP